nr:type II toxin-antitoxin system PemK/MazF family toxin [Planomicrobium sp. YIM 101495]
MSYKIFELLTERSYTNYISLYFSDEGVLRVTYTTKIKAIGNSHGVIIPQEYISEAGTEYTIRKMHPGIVVSKDQFNKVTGFAVVCSITSSQKNFPSNVDLDEQTTTQRQILMSQVRSMDFKVRNVWFSEETSLDILEEV